jgi:hypothetical protein
LAATVPANCRHLCDLNHSVFLASASPLSSSAGIAGPLIPPVFVLTGVVLTEEVPPGLVEGFAEPVSLEEVVAIISSSAAETLIRLV